MAQSYLGQKRLRKYYGKIREVLEMPNLIQVQKSSYKLFLDSGDQLAPMDGEGINGVFQSVFPIKDFNETAILEFVKYVLEKPKYDTIRGLSPTISIEQKTTSQLQFLTDIICDLWYRDGQDGRETRSRTA